MGQATSLPAPFDLFNAWSVREVEELRKKYFLMDLNFGVEVGELKDWLDVDSETAADIIRVFGGEGAERLGALNFLSALAMCVRGNAEEKEQVVFACFDFEDQQKLDAASLGVLLLAAACGTFSLLGHKISYPKKLVRALCGTAIPKGSKDIHIGAFQKWCDEKVDGLGQLQAFDVVVAFGFKLVRPATGAARLTHEEKASVADSKTGEEGKDGGGDAAPDDAGGGGAGAAAVQGDGDTDSKTAERAEGEEAKEAEDAAANAAVAAASAGTPRGATPRGATPAAAGGGSGGTPRGSTPRGEGEDQTAAAKEAKVNDDDLATADCGKVEVAKSDDGAGGDAALPGGADSGPDAAAAGASTGAAGADEAPAHPASASKDDRPTSTSKGDRPASASKDRPTSASKDDRPASGSKASASKGRPTSGGSRGETWDVLHGVEGLQKTASGRYVKLDADADAGSTDSGSTDATNNADAIDVD